MIISQLFRFPVGPLLNFTISFPASWLQGFCTGVCTYSQHWSGLLGGHVLPDERSVFLVCPFDSLSPSGRAAAGIYHSWVWQSCGSHCPMQGGEGRLRRLLWPASELVSPPGSMLSSCGLLVFHMACMFTLIVLRVTQPTSSGRCSLVLLCLCLIVFFQGSGFLRHWPKTTQDHSRERHVTESCPWTPGESLLLDGQEAVGNLSAGFSLCSYLKSPPGAIFLLTHSVLVFLQ